MVREQIYQENFVKQDEEVTSNCYWFSIQWSDLHFLLVQQMSYLPFWNNGNGGHCPQPTPRLLRKWPPPRVSCSLAKVAFHPSSSVNRVVQSDCFVLFSLAQNLLFVLFNWYVFWWAPPLATWYIYFYGFFVEMVKCWLLICCIYCNSFYPVRQRKDETLTFLVEQNR